MTGGVPPYAREEVGGRRCRQPGQVRKEAATTISCRVVGFHLSRFGKARLVRGPPMRLAHDHIVMARKAEQERLAFAARSP